MAIRHHLKRGAKNLLWLYLLSILLISFIGGYIGIRGRKTTYRTLPTQPHEEISFKSQARDQLSLGGWYFPADSQKVAIIVHGWSGNRARLLYLAEYLQRQNINVLTFDLRGGTGQNSYGQKEAQDLAGAVDWLKITKRYNSENITIIGNSIGGAAAINYVATHEVGKLVAVAPIIDIKQTKLTVLKNRHYFFPQIYAAGTTLVEELFYKVKPTNPKDLIEKVTEPTLIIHGTDDELSPINSIFALQERHQSNIQFTIVPSGTHTFLDNDPANSYTYSQQIADFIQK